MNQNKYVKKNNQITQIQLMNKLIKNLKTIIRINLKIKKINQINQMN